MQQQLQATAVNVTYDERVSINNNISYSNHSVGTGTFTSTSVWQ